MTKLTPAGLSLVALLAGCSADGINPSGSGSLPVDVQNLSEINCGHTLSFEDGVDLSQGSLVGNGYGFHDTFLENVGTLNEEGDGYELKAHVFSHELWDEEDTLSAQDHYDDRFLGNWIFLSNWHMEPGVIFYEGEDLHNRDLQGTPYGEALNDLIGRFGLLAYYPENVANPAGHNINEPLLGIPTDEPSVMMDCMDVVNEMKMYYCETYFSTVDVPSLCGVNADATPFRLWGGRY